MMSFPRRAMTLSRSGNLGAPFRRHGGLHSALRGVAKQAHLADQELRQWVQNLTVEQRAVFVDALFNVLSASGAVTLTDLKTDSLKAVGVMIKAMKDLDKETRDGLLEFVGILFKSNFRMILEGIQEETEKKSSKLRKKIKGEET